MLPFIYKTNKRDNHEPGLNTLRTFSDSKRHYAILDGLRGVAAMMVVAFHMFESHSHSRYEKIINHGLSSLTIEIFIEDYFFH